MAQMLPATHLQILEGQLEKLQAFKIQLPFSGMNSPERRARTQETIDDLERRIAIVKLPLTNVSPNLKGKRK